MNTGFSNNARLGFTLEATDAWSKARAATFSTSHGRVATPIFMPVATRAALRGIDTALVEDMGYQVLLSNTFHLLLRPGPDLFRQVGGIHSFMRWPRAILTDSGGFQIFSLSKQLTLSEEGARFRSYVDGVQILLTPEVSIATQQAIGSDIMMVLDHCIDATSDEATSRKALELTTRWAKRSLAARGSSAQALFGIVQGACFPHLRRESAQQICDIPFDGYAIGGLAVGETRAEREDMVEHTAPLLPTDKPRYLMGVGTPIDLLEAVKRGVDMFDCIIPTAFAQQGVCFTSMGKVDLRRGIFKSSERKLDEACQCSTCERFSRAYLHHLIRSGEFLVHQLCAVHNLSFYKSFMANMRQSILAGAFREFYFAHKDRIVVGEEEFPAARPKIRKRAASNLLGDYEIVSHPSGYGSIKQISSGEVMHSVVNPGEEARALYIAQSQLLESAQAPGEELVIWDVGLGAATNAMTLILELERVAEVKRKIVLVSFERDTDPLSLALKQPALFEHVRHAAPHAILNHGAWQHPTKPIFWTLLKGDFRGTMSQALAPEVVWYDPFSYKVDSELWAIEVFKQVLRASDRKTTRMFTYSASTAARATMLAAGWYVGAGIATGPKQETTIAYNENAREQWQPASLLGAKWLERWERSDAKQPFGNADVSLLEAIRTHPQFAGAEGDFGF